MPTHLAAPLRERSEAQRRGARTPPDEQPSGVTGICAHLARCHVDTPGLGPDRQADVAASGLTAMRAPTSRPAPSDRAICERQRNRAPDARSGRGPSAPPNARLAPALRASRRRSDRHGSGRNSALDRDCLLARDGANNRKPAGCGPGGRGFESHRSHSLPDSRKSLQFRGFSWARRWLCAPGHGPGG